MVANIIDIIDIGQSFIKFTIYNFPYLSTFLWLVA